MDLESPPTPERHNRGGQVDGVPDNCSLLADPPELLAQPPSPAVFLVIADGVRRVATL
jgi:hypothetical protein